MGTEIERKFRVADDRWRAASGGTGVAIRQFYLAIRDGFSLRIRIEDERSARLTLKTGSGLARGEFEYDVPLADARELEASRIGAVLEKRRHRVALGAGLLVAEVDVFEGALAPLVLVEVEVPEKDTRFLLPEWFGEEVTCDPRYLNARLAATGRAPADNVAPDLAGMEQPSA